MIKAIIFDCFGVLTADNWQEFLSGLPPDADIEKARQVHRAYDRGELSKVEASEQIREATAQNFVEIDDVEVEGVPKNTRLLMLAKELHDNGYKTSILSNVASNWVRDQFLTTEERAFFDDFVFSHEVGMIKPDPDIFALAVKRLGVQPEESILI